MDLPLASHRLEALGSPTRLAIFRALVRAGRSGASVGSVQAAIARAGLGVAPSTLSHHLKALVAVGLVTQEREGTTLICRADFPAMRDLLGFLAAECCADDRADAAAA